MYSSWFTNFRKLQLAIWPYRTIIPSLWWLGWLYIFICFINRTFIISSELSIRAWRLCKWLLWCIHAAPCICHIQKWFRILFRFFAVSCANSILTRQHLKFLIWLTNWIGFKLFLFNFVLTPFIWWGLIFIMINCFKWSNATFIHIGRRLCWL